MCVKESITIIHNLLGDNCLLILTVVMVSWVYKDTETDQSILLTYVMCNLLHFHYNPVKLLKKGWDGEGQLHGSQKQRLREAEPPQGQSRQYRSTVC